MASEVLTHQLLSVTHREDRSICLEQHLLTFLHNLKPLQKDKKGTPRLSDKNIERPMWGERRCLSCYTADGRLVLWAAGLVPATYFDGDV
jgi:hypothetical protein